MYTLANMQESIKKVEATRAQRMANEPRRMTADEMPFLQHIIRTIKRKASLP